MKTIDIITGLNTYLKTENKSIIEELLNKLDVQYTEFYQNEKETGTSCFKSDIGMALLCPCRLKNEVA